MTDNKVNIRYLLFFYARRLMITVAVVFWRDYLFLQIFQMYMQITIQVVMIGYLRPQRTEKEYVLEFFNEGVILFSTYMIMSCSNWVPDEDVKYQIGYVLVFVVSTHLLINLSLVLKVSCIDLNQKCCILSDKERAANAKKKRAEKKKKQRQV